MSGDGHTRGTGHWSRGRVLGVLAGGERILVRTAQGDIEAPRGRARPGDLIELDARPSSESEPVIVRAHGRADYPGPQAEVARMSPGRIRALHRRAELMDALRRWFAERGFLEVETPQLVPAPGLELHLAAVPAGAGQWLITSPEFQMKRLLAAGLERIYTVCKCFRAGEDGSHHASEFTMLEWYRGWSDLEAIVGDTEDLVARVAEAVSGRPVVQVGQGGLQVAQGGLPAGLIDVTPPWRRMTVAEAMERFAGVTVTGDEEPGALAESLRRAGVDLGGAVAWDDLFYTAFVSRVEPQIARLPAPLLLTDWPAPLGALARRKPGDPRVVERFEAYIGGIELANAFGELTDPAEQRARFAADLAARAERGLPRYPLDDAFLAALEEGLPPCAGIALGIDRLAMLVTGAGHIRDVLSFTAGEL